MEKRNHRYEVVATGFEEEWNMFFGDPEEAWENGWTVEGGDILTVHEHVLEERVFPSLKAARKYVAHESGTPMKEVIRTNSAWNDPDLSRRDYRSMAHARNQGFDYIQWEIKEID